LQLLPHKCLFFHGRQTKKSWLVLPSLVSCIYLALHFGFEDSIQYLRPPNKLGLISWIKSSTTFFASFVHLSWRRTSPVLIGRQRYSNNNDAWYDEIDVHKEVFFWLAISLLLCF
jgi:hypothetical protein